APLRNAVDVGGAINPERSAVVELVAVELLFDVGLGPLIGKCGRESPPGAFGERLFELQVDGVVVCLSVVEAAVQLAREAGELTILCCADGGRNGRAVPIRETAWNVVLNPRVATVGAPGDIACRITRDEARVPTVLEEIGAGKHEQVARLDVREGQRRDD